MINLFQIWSNFLVFFFVATLSPGLEINNGIQGYAVAGICYAFLISFMPQIIEFFKVNVNFWSFVVFGSIFSTLFFLFFNFILVGFIRFSAVSSEYALFGLGYLRGFTLTQIQTIIFAGVFGVVIAGINQWIIDR